MKTSNAIQERIRKLNESYLTALKLEEAFKEEELLFVDSNILLRKENLPEALETLKKVSKELKSASWKLEQIWNGFPGQMAASWKFKDFPVEVWLSMPIKDFPIEKLSPGCKIEKETQPEEKFIVVCPLKKD